MQYVLTLLFLFSLPTAYASSKKGGTDMEIETAISSSLGLSIQMVEEDAYKAIHPDSGNAGDREQERRFSIPESYIPEILKSGQSMSLFKETKDLDSSLPSMPRGEGKVRGIEESRYTHEYINLRDQNAPQFQIIQGLEDKHVQFCRVLAIGREDQSEIKAKLLERDHLLKETSLEEGAASHSATEAQLRQYIQVLENEKAQMGIENQALSTRIRALEAVEKGSLKDQLALLNQELGKKTLALENAECKNKHLQRAHEKLQKEKERLADYLYKKLNQTTSEPMTLLSADQKQRVIQFIIEGEATIHLGRPSSLSESDNADFCKSVREKLLPYTAYIAPDQATRLQKLISGQMDFDWFVAYYLNVKSGTLKLQRDLLE